MAVWRYASDQPLRVTGNTFGLLHIGTHFDFNPTPAIASLGTYLFRQNGPYQVYGNYYQELDAGLRLEDSNHQGAESEIAGNLFSNCTAGLDLIRYPVHRAGGRLRALQYVHARHPQL